MTETSQFLINHGMLLVFGAVFVEQMGLPLPAAPWLLAAGALSATGQFSPVRGIAVTVLACLLADVFWFYLGRRRGSQVLALLCRISLEPDTCVRRTQDTFARYGFRSVVAAKFFPGLSTVAPPLAGMSRMGLGQFLLLDGFGSLLYCGSLVLLGYFFSAQLEEVVAALAHVGGSALGLIAALVAGYIGFKYWQRRRLLRELRMARVTVAELRQKQETGEEVVILDMRSRAALEEDPSVIQGAIHLGLDDVEKRSQGIPRDREVIVYCSCPNEVTSARVALLLRRKGFTRVRPLLGGIDAWREQNYPVASVRTEISTHPGGTTGLGVAPNPLPLRRENHPARKGDGEAP